MGAAANDLVARLDMAHSDVGFGVYLSDPGGIDKNPVALAAFHHLGVASYDVNAGAFGGLFDADEYIPEFLHGQALFENKREGQVARRCATHGQVVHGAVHGQFADVSAGKKDGRNHIAVGAEG